MPSLGTRLAALTLFAVCGLAAVSIDAGAATDSQPIAFDRDIPRHIYSITNVSMPNVAWARFTLSLNWSAGAPLDVYIMRCGDADRFQQTPPSDPLFVGAGASGNMHAVILKRNFTDPEVCIVLDNTDLGATPSPLGAEGDPLHVHVEGVETASTDEEGTLDAGPGANGNFVVAVVLALVVIGSLGAILVIGHRRRPKEVHVEKSLTGGPPPPGYP